MIEDVVERWHRHLAGELPGGLDELLADDVVFWSPVVHTPQRGKDVTTLYLTGAAHVPLPGGFRCTRQVLDGDTAVLEPETEVDGASVNGVDVRCDAADGGAGRIVEPRVMLRPLRGLNAVFERMAALLADVIAGPAGSAPPPP